MTEHVIVERGGELVIAFQDRTTITIYGAIDPPRSLVIGQGDTLTLTVPIEVTFTP